jgi:hypothetical protein
MEKVIARADNSFMMKHMNFQAPFFENFFWTFLPAVIVVALGALINKLIEWWEGGTTTTNKWQCTGYFAAQLAINAVILLVLARNVDSFVVWLQLTVSGIVSAVLFFLVQTRLASNANCVVGNTV